MNFQKVNPVPSSKALLDTAFSRARVQGKAEDFTGNWLQIIRKKEVLKLGIVQETLVSRLEQGMRTFPEVDQLPQFYQKLIRLTLDYQALKKSCGALGWAIKKIQYFHSDYVQKVNLEKQRPNITLLMRQFYGRVSSIMKQIEPNLAYLEDCRKIMKDTYPDVKEMFTVCIYGFPNVGKSTLLNKLCGTKAKVAAYSFTTKSINSGFMEKNGRKVQVLDVPGTLDRKDKMNNIELLADLVLKDLANVIIYVFDLSDSSGYSIKKQEQLLQNLGKHKPVLVYLSKKDLLSPEILAEWKREQYTLEELKEKIFELQ